MTDINLENKLSRKFKRLQKIFSAALGEVDKSKAKEVEKIFLFSSLAKVYSDGFTSYVQHFNSIETELGEKIFGNLHTELQKAVDMSRSALGLIIKTSNAKKQPSN